MENMPGVIPRVQKNYSQIWKCLIDKSKHNDIQPKLACSFIIYLPT